MNRMSRISAVYCKELLDILRDRRTLIAMVIVPVVLYPMLMLLSFQATETQIGRISQEPYTVAVPDEQTRAWLLRAMGTVGAYQAAATQAAPPAPPAAVQMLSRDRPPPPGAADPVVVWPTVVIDPDVEAAVRGKREVELTAPDGQTTPQTVLVGLSLVEPADHPPFQPRFFFDPRNARSELAMNRLLDVLRRYGEICAEQIRERLIAQGVEPWKLATLSAPVSPERTPVAQAPVLAHIVPIVLVLMTITGAIYPAIDLTAGERERGTLQTLMVCPVPTIELITGKFLVVATVALITALLNVASLGVSIQVSGVAGQLGRAGGLPSLWRLGMVVVMMVPFAVLSAAMLMAVCSFARTFREAQNYVMPLIIAVLIPAMLAALPGVVLRAHLAVVPVANMVLLTRDLLMADAPNRLAIVLVLGSTTLYAAAAVALAARLFGSESVVFTDAGSYRALMQRRLIKPRARPSAAGGLLLLAVIFPAYFYWQLALGGGEGVGGSGLFVWTAVMIAVLFAALPIAVCRYFRIDLSTGLRLAPPVARVVVSGVLIGSVSWVLGHEVAVWQLERVFAIRPEQIEVFARLEAVLRAMPLWQVLGLMAVVPAIGEEIFFRGWLLGSLRSALGKWGAIAVVAVIFGMFHVSAMRLAVTIALGAVLGYLCWQGRSVVPAMVAHLLHNGFTMLSARPEQLPGWLARHLPEELGHFAWPVVAAAAAVFVAGLGVAASVRRGRNQ